MVSRIFTFLLLCFSFIGTTTFAETLIEKENNARGLTAVELTAISLAEIKDCEERVPEFKSQDWVFVEKFKNHPKTKEIVRSPDFEKVAFEAADFVKYRRRGVDIKHQCSYTLSYIKNLIIRNEHKSQ